MIRVLIVDDHPVVRRGLTRLLTGAGFEVVGEACTGQAGIERARELAPDVVLWDIAMPGGGLAAIRELTRRAPGVRVRVLTASDDPLLAREAAEQGADGFLAKTRPPEELISLVRECASGGGFPRPQADLSPRERELVELVAAGLSNKEIASRLEISVKTVEAHLEKLKRKLGFPSTADFKAWAIRRRGLNMPR